MPIVPLLIVLGLAGWEEFEKASQFWQKNRKLLIAGMVFFWAVNITMLMAFTPMYSKKARVESMSYLRNYPQTKYFVVEDNNSDILRFPPVYYSGQWPRYETLIKHTDYKSFAASRNWEEKTEQPEFVLFYQETDLQARVDSMQKYLQNLIYETSFKPGMMDRLIHRINPINANETITLYRNQALVPQKANE